jgi:hypothetical protein
MVFNLTGADAEGMMRQVKDLQTANPNTRSWTLSPGIIASLPTACLPGF